MLCVSYPALNWCWRAGDTDEEMDTIAENEYTSSPGPPESPRRDAEDRGASLVSSLQWLWWKQLLSMPAFQTDLQCLSWQERSAVQNVPAVCSSALARAGKQTEQQSCRACDGVLGAPSSASAQDAPGSASRIRPRCSSSCRTRTPPYKRCRWACHSQQAWPSVNSVCA